MIIISILVYMLQVRLNLQVNSFPNQVNLFNLGQFCFNPCQFGAGTKHRSQVIVLPIQKVSSTFIKANLRPKQMFLGLMLAFING